jgi:hypothetical protein
VPGCGAVSISVWDAAPLVSVGNGADREATP